MDDLLEPKAADSGARGMWRRSTGSKFVQLVAKWFGVIYIECVGEVNFKSYSKQTNVNGDVSGELKN